MLQIQLNRFGPPSVLVPTQAPDPTPSPNEVLIACEAVGVTYVETQVRAGRPPWSAPPPSLPLVLGNGVGGVVVAVGAAGDRTLVGRRVIAATGGSGGYAEQAVVPSTALFEVPASVEMSAAVAVLADGRTAAAIVRAADIRPGDRVLILAAAGGVGTFLVQMATAAGAEVVGAASSSSKRQVALDLGASECLDYGTADWIGARAFDVVLDGVGGAIGAAATQSVSLDGRVVLHGAASGAFSDSDAFSASIAITALHELVKSPADNRALVEQVLAQAATGAVRPIVGQSVPLAHADRAHAAIEARATTGKTVLIP